MTAVRTDAFTRADGAIGATYSACDAGSLVISSNKIKASGAGVDAWMIDNANTYNNDQYSQQVVGSVSSGLHDMEPVVRGTATAQFYSFYHAADGSIHIVKLIGGVFSEISTTAYGALATVGQVWRIDVIGTTISVYVDGVLKATTTDSSATTGRAGPGMYNATNTGDDWEGGNTPYSSGGGGSTDAFHLIPEAIAFRPLTGIH